MFSTIEALTRRLELTPEALKIKAVEWHGELRQFDPQSLIEAARAHCRASPRWPSLSEILAASREVRRELADKLPKPRKSYRDEAWKPPTAVEKARIRLMAAAVTNGYGFDWYHEIVRLPDDAILAEAAKFAEGGRVLAA